MTRADKVEIAQVMRREGLLLREIAAEFGVTLTTVSDWLVDPDRSRVRARRRQYAGACASCGKPTAGDRPGRAPKHCLACAPDARRVWTRERVVAAIRDFAERYGRQPSASDWNPSMPYGITGDQFHADGCWPRAKSVLDAWGSWSAAIEAAGFPPLAPGQYDRAEKGLRPSWDVDEARRLRGEGMTFAELAARYGKHYNTVWRKLREQVAA